MPERPRTETEHERLIRERLARVPEIHGAEDLERLGRASLADDLLGGGAR